ncbi:MAG: dihydroorotase [Legionellales bacterium RIFCSPHIGHO2_12_FULL_37_14]|nr:MAG: dihydroorotase [Legionellales bacterium RIFCSPHIGHO2_12_FULL_37_14]
MKYIEIIYPDDWHVHLRDKDCLPDTVQATAFSFLRALAMPNLAQPVTTIDDLLQYRERIIKATPKSAQFLPYMTLYLNDQTTAETLNQAKKFDFILGAKLYPQHATTNSALGAANILDLYPLFEVMQTNDLVLQVHGEDVTADIFDKEERFINNFLKPICKQFPRLRVVLEHISTKAAIDFVTNTKANIAATITPHHLLYNRNDLLNQGIKPHLYCLPILKRREDQAALRLAATSGNPKFFAGTDSAPHAKNEKESNCGCAGIFSSPYAVAIYAQIFEDLNKLDYLEAFLSKFGAEFYNLPLNQQTLTLAKRSQTIPFELPFGKNKVVPIAAGESIAWSIYEH